MNRFLQWEQLTLMQQLNCICNTLAKKSITTALNHGCHEKQTLLLPKEDVALFIWGNKLTGNISLPLRFHASKEVARKYLATIKRTNGQTNVSMQWTENIWTLPLSPRRICTRFGGPSNIWVSVVQGFRLANTPVRYSQTRDVQITAREKSQRTLCSAPMKTALDY
jgi:hypothetical protein